MGGGRGTRSGRASLGETALLAAGETGLLALGETALLSCAWEGTEWTDRERPRLWWRCVRLLLCGTRGVGDRRLCLGVLDRAPGDGSRLFASKSHNFSTTRHCSLERERDRPMHCQLSSPRAHCRKAFSFHNLSNPPTLAAPVASPFAPPVTRPFADRHAEMRHCGLNLYPCTHCSMSRQFRQAGSRPERNVNRLGCTAALDWRFEY